MKILVTGASGFLGKALVKRLSKLNHQIVEVSTKNCDLTNADSIKQFNDIKFDQIYHLAAWTQAGDFCLYHPAEQWLINQKIHTHVLDWWKNFQPQAKMITMGTSCSYDPNMPHVEENYLKGRPIDSLFTYAMTKRMLLTGLMALNKQFNLNYLYLIPSTLYGSNYHTDERQLHFIFDLIRKIISSKYYQTKTVLWGNGEQKRELVHIQDFISIMLQLVETQSNSIINIGAGEDYSIKTFAKKICDVVGYDFSEIEFDITKYVGAKSKFLINDKLNKILPNYRKKTLDEGLEDTISWFLQNKKQLITAR